MSAPYPPSITRNRPTIVVEQLNGCQWHAVLPGDRGTGVTNYVDALAYALLVGEVDGLAVESIGEDGERLLLCYAGGRA